MNRPIANMATISPKRGFSVATVARDWLPLFTSAVAAKIAASQASFPLNSTKISQFSSLKKVSIWHTRFGYWFSFSFFSFLKDQLTHSDHRQSHLYSDRDTLTARYFSFIVFKVHM